MTEQQQQKSDIKIPLLNRVTIAGRLARSAEARYTPAGMAITGLCVAVDVSKGRGEAREKRAAFVDVTTFDKLAEHAATLGKGAPVVIEGRLDMDAWEDKATGQKRTQLKVIADRVHSLVWG